MISNLRISVAELVVWALLAAAGLTWISFRVVDGAAWLMDWLRDRVSPLLEDDKPESGCDCCELDEYDGPLSIERDGTCAKCGHPDLWHVASVEVGDQPPLPPERTWEQMTSHQLPVVGMSPAERKDWQRLERGRKRQAKRVEMTYRAHYAAMGFEFPSGLLARVRELAP